MQLTRTHRILIGVVVAGAVVIAAIGFVGSYAAVRELAEQKGFGSFSAVFPIGIDAGICVLLALDLLLTWIRIPFPLLRQTAWLLTAATIAFNGAAAWPDPLGTGMHAVIPVLFVVAVEAARHAVGRIADITADKHMEGVRITRWLLSPVPTFRLWRRMKLWELRSYDQVIKLEQERLVYQARLRSRYGRAWRRKAPVESLMPLRLARYGVPLAETAPAGLAAAGIEPALLPPAPTPAPAPVPAPRQPELTTPPQAELPQASRRPQPQPEPEPRPQPRPEREREPEPQPEPEVLPHASPWFAKYPASYVPEEPYDQWYEEQAPYDHGPHADEREETPRQTAPEPEAGPEAEPEAVTEAEAEAEPVVDIPGLPEDISREEAYFTAFRKYVSELGDYPNARQFSLYLMDLYGVTGQAGGPLTESTLRPYLRDFRSRYQQDLDAGAEHIA
ncbi:DUF2637 domain-containing protein [Streptomyces sp. WAC 01529]|uniref:DUF2637 domain-containing protein n=1 Tax=Streptomyces sp. WAC 01529 TaxID=2203205 RepID=UPI001F0BD1C8|nr:DUF2637 domain-containing protein [Streptomyces sp. WAC 01529]